MWLMVDEAHITTFAVHPARRRPGLGERLLLACPDLARGRHAREAPLAGRLSHLARRRLDEEFGFRPVGLRPRYFSDNNEDALIMTSDPLDDRSFRARIERLRVALDDLPGPTGPFEPDDPDDRPAGSRG